MGFFQNGLSWLKQQAEKLMPKQEKSEETYTTHVQTIHGADTPFGNGEGTYGGRTPYQSQKDAQAAAQAAAKAAAQATAVQSAPQQRPQAEPVQQPAMQKGFVAQNPAENVIQFPNTYIATESNVCTHVEYVILLKGLLECKDVIAYMKTSASVFLNMEFVASEAERQRCVDMLSGAACTLGCNLQKISTHGMYLISAPDVRVIVDPALKQATGAPSFRSFSTASTPVSGFSAPQPPQAQPMHRMASHVNMQQQPSQPVYRQPSMPVQAVETPVQSQPSQLQPETEAQGIRPITAFGTGSPTTRFQAQGHRSRATYGSVMDGGVNAAPNANEGFQRSAQ